MFVIMFTLDSTSTLIRWRVRIPHLQTARLIGLRVKYLSFAPHRSLKSWRLDECWREGQQSFLSLSLLPNLLLCFQTVSILHQYGLHASMLKLYSNPIEINKLPSSLTLALFLWIACPTRSLKFVVSPLIATRPSTSCWNPLLTKRSHRSHYVNF